MLKYIIPVLRPQWRREVVDEILAQIGIIGQIRIKNQVVKPQLGIGNDN